MKCSLTSIVQGLKTDFSVETCGDLNVQITDIQEITPEHLPVRSDVLYIIQQNQLLKYHETTARGPVLCISHTDWNLRGSQASFPVMIKVLCPDPVEVYAALGRHLYQEGARTSQMPEVSGTFLRCKSMDALVETGYSYLGNPFAIHDGDGKLLAWSRQAGFRDAAWQSEAFLETFCDLYSVENAANMERSRRDQMPVLLHPESGPEQMRMALSSRGQTLGYLTAVAQFHPFTKEDQQVVELLGCFITLDLLRQNTIARISASDAGRLKSFLESGETNMPEIPQWLENQRAREGEKYYLMLLNTKPSRNMPFWDMDEALSQLDRLFPGGISTRLEAGIVLLFQSSVPAGSNPELKQLLRKLPPALAAGISMPFTSLADSGHAAMRQVRVALELGCVLSPEESCFFYEDYAVYVGLRAAADRIDLRELLKPELRELMASDENGEMLRTLEVYLSTGGKKARAAELLFIHLNTLKYRLTQLSQRLGVDMDDPGTLFSLEYSLHIIRYLRHFGETK